MSIEFLDDDRSSGAGNDEVLDAVAGSGLSSSFPQHVERFTRPRPRLALGLAVAVLAGGTLAAVTSHPHGAVAGSAARRVAAAPSPATGSGSLYEPVRPLPAVDLLLPGTSAGSSADGKGHGEVVVDLVSNSDVPLTVAGVSVSGLDASIERDAIIARRLKMDLLGGPLPAALTTIPARAPVALVVRLRVSCRNRSALAALRRAHPAARVVFAGHPSAATFDLVIGGSWPDQVAGICGAP